MPTNGLQIMANGNIAPCRFVKLDTTAGKDQMGVQAGANDQSIGISGTGTNQPPLSDLITTQYHAQAGDPISLHKMGDVTLLEIGAAVVAGNLLKSDVDGKGVPIATSGATLQKIGAKALQTETTVGAKVLVEVLEYSEVSPT